MDSTSPAEHLHLADQLSAGIGPAIGVLSRTVVLWQLIAILMIVGVAWIVPRATFRFNWSLGSDRIPRERPARWRSWTIGLRELTAPIVALALLSACSWLLSRLGLPYGILEQFGAVVCLWLVYKIVISLVYARYGPAARPYQTRLITPAYVVLLVWLGIVPWFTKLGDATIGIGGLRASVGSIVSAPVISYVFLVAGWVLEQALNRSLTRRLNAEANVVASVTILVRYAAIAMGIVVSLCTLGFDPSSLTLVAGGLSVGIGIGLQDILANFIYGLILLAEQSLRPGDIIVSRVRSARLRRSAYGRPPCGHRATWS